MLPGDWLPGKLSFPGIMCPSVSECPVIFFSPPFVGRGLKGGSVLAFLPPKNILVISKLSFFLGRQE
jgi:hypothetical protein